MTRARLLLSAAVIGVLAAGCGTAAQPGAIAPQADQVSRVRLVLKPATGKPVVKIRGLVNGGRPVAVDLASLNALPKHKLTVVEPFLKKSMTFTGVSFADLLTAAKATGTSVTMHALDDYQATLKTSVLRDQGVLLATQVGGKDIELKSGGPVRMVFPASSKAGRDSDLWVWSVDQITLK